MSDSTTTSHPLRGLYLVESDKDEKNKTKLNITPREIQCAEHWIAGLSKKQVGRLLFIGESTVNTNIHRLRDKLNSRGYPVHNQSLLLAALLQCELTTVDKVMDLAHSNVGNDRGSGEGTAC